MSPPRAVLLDALGTLLELEPPAPRLRRELRERCGLRVSLPEARAAVAAEIAYYRAHHDEGHDRAALAALRWRCGQVVRDALPGGRGVATRDVTAALLASLRFHAYPDAAPALRRLRRRGLRLVVVSNWDVSLHDRLAETGLAALLHGAISSAELGTGKPAPAIFRHALTLAGVPAADAVHVGDTPEVDVAGARAAGIAPLLLVRGDGRAPRGVPVARSLREVADMLL
jgi:putative hydrolase of the HAD superfamily